MSALTVRRELDASPERVWGAWTDPHALAAWFWPEGFGTTCALDPRPGGLFRITSPVVGIGVTGEVREARAPRHLGLTWSWDGEDVVTTVDVTFEGDDAATAVTVVHDGFAGDAARDEHVQGWADCLDRLPGFLAG